LSIIDLEQGAQPISNLEKTIWLTFNGEIYNYIELREKLIKKGYQFRTSSDSEVLVYLYAEYGASMLELINGMFAFVIYDLSDKKIFFARDRFGEKPLYYTQSPDKTTYISSEINAITKIPNIEKEIDFKAITYFLRKGYIPAPDTQYKNIKKLKASEAALIDKNGNMKKWIYWKPKFNFDHKLKFSEIIEETRHRLDQSVKLRLRSDVKLGAFLSGGIDSSLVVNTIRELNPQMDIRTFCMSFPGSALDESKEAKNTAKVLNTDHYELSVTENDLLSELNHLIDHCGEPFADPSILPTYLICKFAREKVKVMLSGDGGDEAFCGYSEYFRYFPYEQYRDIPLIRNLFSILSLIYPTKVRGSVFVNRMKFSDEEIINNDQEWSFVSSMLSKDYKELVVKNKKEMINSQKSYQNFKFPLRAMLFDMRETYLPEQILFKVDRASMRVGLESRAPFLDHNLIEFALGIPNSMNIKNRFGKRVLREALPDTISKDIKWGRKKGFTPPLGQWFRSVLKNELYSSVQTIPKDLDGYISNDFLIDIFEKHQQGEDHTLMLYRWYVLNRILQNNA